MKNPPINPIRLPATSLSDGFRLAAGRMPTLRGPLGTVADVSSHPDTHRNRAGEYRPFPMPANMRANLPGQADEDGERLFVLHVTDNRLWGADLQYLYTRKPALAVDLWDSGLERDSEDTDPETGEWTGFNPIWGWAAPEGTTHAGARAALEVLAWELAHRPFLSANLGRDQAWERLDRLQDRVRTEYAANPSPENGKRLTAKWNRARQAILRRAAHHARRVQGEMNRAAKRADLQERRRTFDQPADLRRIVLTAGRPVPTRQALARIKHNRVQAEQDWYAAEREQARAEREAKEARTRYRVIQVNPDGVQHVLGVMDRDYFARHKIKQLEETAAGDEQYEGMTFHFEEFTITPEAVQA